jgi:hypothetical protein
MGTQPKGTLTAEEYVDALKKCRRLSCEKDWMPQ